MATTALNPWIDELQNLMDEHDGKGRGILPLALSAFLGSLDAHVDMEPAVAAAVEHAMKLAREQVRIACGGRS